MIPLVSVFKEELILLNPPHIENKKTCLAATCHLLSQHNPSLKQQAIFDALHERERIGHTAIIPNVAIPHARITDLTDPIGVITKLLEPISFSSDTDVSVKLLFTLLVPEEATDEHLGVLGQLADRLKSEQWVNRLLDSTSPHELWMNFCNH